MTYYAVSYANGPITVSLEGDTPEEATAYAEAHEYGSAEGSDDGLGRNWVDSARADLEDVLEEDWVNVSSGDLDEVLEKAGLVFVCDLGEGWALWSLEE